MKKYLVISFIILAGLAISPFVSQFPDGLEASLEPYMADTEEMHPVIGAPAPDYMIPGIESPFVSGLLAGALGVVITLSAGILFAKLIKRGK